MKVAVYLRVSTSDQSTDIQRKDILAFVQARGWSVHEIYEDHGKTGTNTKRPALQKMLRDAKERKVDAVVVWKLDRLFRSLKDLIHTLSDWNALGVQFVSLRDHIDLTTPSGRLLVQMLGAVSEFEASLIKERVKAGLSHARAKGVVLGRKVEIEKSDLIRLRQSGLSMTCIAKQLGVTKSGVSRACKRYAIS